MEIGNKKFNQKLDITKSSVNYFILSFLPPLQICRMGQLNKRFYNLYVPVTLQTVTERGTQPNMGSRQSTFVLQLELSENLLMLKLPRKENDSLYKPRNLFWKSLHW